VPNCTHNKIKWADRGALCRHDRLKPHPYKTRGGSHRNKKVQEK
jgi:hypothetical protein